jgi:hypothetical protein
VQAEDSVPVPASVSFLPAAQLEQLPEPDPLYWPVLQLVHADDSVPVAEFVSRFPAAHDEHEDEVPPLYFPVPQSEHELQLELLYFPAAQLSCGALSPPSPSPQQFPEEEDWPGQ